MHLDCTLINSKIIFPCNNKHYMLNSVPQIWCIKKAQGSIFNALAQLWCNICTLNLNPQALTFFKALALPALFWCNILMAGFLYRAGAETPLNFREKFEFFPERFWKISQGWIPKPQFWYPPLRFGSQHRIPKHLFFLVFWVSTADFGFFLPGDEKFRIFS